MGRSKVTVDSGLIDLDALLRQMEEAPPSARTSASERSSASERASASERSSGSEREGTGTAAGTYHAAPDSLEAVVVAAPVSAPRVAVTPRLPPLVEAPRPPRAARPKARRAVRVAAALALAAGLVVVVRRAPRVAEVPMPTELVAVAAAKPAPVPAPSHDGLADPASLPVAEEPAHDALRVAPAAPSARAAAARPSTAAKPEAPAAPDDAELRAAMAAAPAGAPGDLGAALRTAVGAKDEATSAKVDTTDPNARQLRPSQGAVVGAINSVLPGARACLGPDDPIRSGSIVFRADGAVARVDMKGEKDADACIRAALAKARVAPFVDDTFTTRVTVRP